MDPAPRREGGQEPSEQSASPRTPQAQGAPAGAPRVAIVGGGMAGLAAAFRLAERGYQVTLFEERPYLGGEFGAHSHDGGRTYHEHCYHLLLNWYHNLWSLARDAGIDLATILQRQPALHYLYPGEYPDMPAVRNQGSLDTILDNLFSGVVPAPDMFLYMYSLLDLASQPITGRLLDHYTVNSFVQSRPYSSERSAQLHDQTLLKAFAIPSYQTSAQAYKNWVQYGMRRPDPMMWMMKGDVEQVFHAPLAAALRRAGCRIELSTRVTGLVTTARPNQSSRITEIQWSREPHEWGCKRITVDAKGLGLENYDPTLIGRAERGTEPVDYAVLAVQQDQLGKLLKNVPAVLDKLPRIAALRTEPMASLDLYFNEKFEGLPREAVVCMDSELGLTFVDKSQLWPGLPTTVLEVVSTSFGNYAHLDEEYSARAILSELGERYLPIFGPRTALERRSHYEPNLAATLFLNDIASEDWRPDATTAVPNLFLAGDYCRNFIDVVTVEGAVVSGLQAARVLQRQVSTDRPGVPDAWLRPIRIEKPDTYAEPALYALKVLLAPYAAAAKCWSLAFEAAGSGSRARGAGARGQRAAGRRHEGRSMVGELADDGLKLLVAPYALAAELCRTGFDMWRGILR